MAVRKRFNLLLPVVLFLVVFLMIIPLPMSKGTIVNRKNVTQTQTKKVPIEFSHSEDFYVNIPETSIEATEFNGSEFLDALDEFNQTGVNVYLGEDLIPGSTEAIPESGSLSYLVVNITESYIYDDNEPVIDPSPGGEIYFKIWANGNYTRFPQEDTIEGVDNGETVPIDVIGFTGWTWNNTVEVEVWESDTGGDDYLGKVSYSTGNPIDETIELRTDDGDANVTIQFIVTGSKNTLTAQDLLWGYQPYLYIDDETSGTEEPDGIYGRVCVGNDEVMGKTLWVLQYFFYWEKETYGTSLAEVQLHKYDYEELLIFLDPTDITKPSRIAFDQATNPLYPSHEFVVYEQNPPSTGMYDQKVNFTENLQPFLGVNLTIPYRVEDITSLSGDSFPAQLGGQTIKLTIDTFYHAFDSGEGSNETAYNYNVQMLTDSVIKDWYSHLNESLYGTIHDISIIGFTTPEISPFTFDVTNPFQRPYIINAWTNVMEDLDAFAQAQSQDIIMSADMNITITVAVEALLTVEYPETVEIGETYDLNYSIEMYDETMILTTDYGLDLNVSANFWFLGGEFLLYQTGSFEVDIPLATINGLLDRAGVSAHSFVDRIVDNINEYLTTYYLEVEYITVSPQLIGTVLNASVRLHFWDIAKDFIPVIVSSVAPQFYPAINTAFKVLDRIISHIDLQAVFLVQTMITGDLTLSDVTLAHLSQDSIEFNESNDEVPVTLVIDDSPTKSDLQITLSNFVNGLNFFIEWYFDAGLEQPFSLFIDDFSVYIGTYPSIEMDVPEGWIVANVSSIAIDLMISGIPEDSSETTISTTAITTTAATTTAATTTAATTTAATTTAATTSKKSTSEPGSGLLFIEVFTIAALIGIITRRKRRAK